MEKLELRFTYGKENLVDDDIDQLDNERQLLLL